MNELDDLQTAEALDATWPPSDPGVEREPRPCLHPKYLRVYAEGGWTCSCGHLASKTNTRRGRQSRNYGNRAELAVAKKYGGTKIGHAGGPVDVRGADFATQVKTHRRMPPAEWTKAFAAMSASRGVPRLLLRFVMGTGVPPVDYFVFPAEAFLEWFGKDEDSGVIQAELAR